MKKDKKIKKKSTGATTSFENNFEKSNFINNMGNMKNQMNWNQELMMNNSMINNNMINNNMINTNNKILNLKKLEELMDSMNLMQNNNINNKTFEEILDGNKNEDLDYQQIGLHFVIMGDGVHNKISIQCLLDEKVSDVIQRYRIKTGDQDISKKFFFNSRSLNPEITVAEAGLNNMAHIYVEPFGEISGGGYSMMFTDTSKNKTREIKFSKNAPSYRGITKGINIFGICNFKKCKAYKEEVVVNVKKKKLDLIKERDELFCPECEATIIPKTVGFYLCKFIIYGKKIENGKEESFRNKEDEANNKDSVKYFDPELNGEVMVTELVFEVLEYL